MADYPNPDRLAGLMRAFDIAVTGKAQTHLLRQQLAKTAKEQLEVLARSSPDGPGELIVYVPHQKKPRRPLNPFSMFRYIRDNIRLRKYNDEWIKNNLR
jgi:hypothetical protein